MARMNDDAQWIILMGFIISFSLFFLASVIDQSTLVGQTTAENVQDYQDIRNISLSRKGAVVDYSGSLDNNDPYTIILIHYNNGVTVYNETWTSP